MRCPTVSNRGDQSLPRERDGIPDGELLSPEAVEIVRLRRKLYDITRLVADWTWETNAELVLQDVSFRAFDVLGLHRVELIGRRLSDIGTFVEVGGARCTVEWNRPFRDRLFKALDRDGREKLHLVASVPVFDPRDGAFVGTRGTALDVTERHEMMDRLRKLSTAIEQSPAAVIITDVDGTIEYVNRRFEQVTGYAADEAVGRNPRMLKSGYMPHDTYAEMWAALVAGREWRGDLHNRRKNGEFFWESATIAPIKGRDGANTHYVAVKEDITLRKEYERRLMRQANFDSVTGLPNRVLAFDRLTQALAQARRGERKVALMYLDIDRFQRVNEEFGHAAGDRALREIGRRISECLRDGDTVARLGADEFAVIMPDLGADLDAEPVATKILGAVSEPFVIDGADLELRPTIGVTIGPDDGDDPDILMRNAELATRRAKEEGRNVTSFFTPELNEQARHRARIEKALRHALENGEFAVHYQPIIELKTGAIVRAEALLRWRNAELGTVRPDVFIPIAEETGVIVPLGAWVLDTACRECARWASGPQGPVGLSVNVSGQQFGTSTLADVVAVSLADSGIDPRLLQLEITENLLLADVPQVHSTMDALRGQDVRLSLDDFGTGYSSLGYLQRFSVSMIKIDRSFIRNVPADEGDASLVEAIIAMARGLRTHVTAEGVETAEQMWFLRSLGCDLAQGFLISHPLPADEFAALVAGWDGARFFSGLDDG